MKTVSVIVPVFNTEEFVDECIHSIVNQSYRQIEVVIIIDGSTDLSEERIKKWHTKDNRIQVIKNKVNKGVPFSRNKALQHITGDYVYFVDSDDYIEQNAIKNLVENIGEYNIAFGKQETVTVSDVTLDNDYELINSEIIKEGRFSKVRKISILNKLFKMSFIKKHNLQFDERAQRYSELTFLIPALLNSENITYITQSVYFKRKRNDPISNPALMQTGMEDRINDFYDIYLIVKEDFGQYDEVNKLLDKHFIRLYRKSIVKYFKKNENVDKVFDKLVDMARMTDNRTIQNKPRMIKREFKLLCKGDIKKYKRANLWHHRIRRGRKAIRKRSRLYIEIYRSIFLKCPLQKKTVIFESFLGKSYSDSPKYIYEFMLENNKDYKFVWSVNEKRTIPGNPIQVRRFSLKYFYYMAVSKYWVSNSRLPRFLHKRDENIYLQTWHGTPLKMLVFDMKDVHSADPAYKQNFYKQSRRWDYLHSPNEYSTDIFKRAFKFDKKMLEFGYPRNDILYTKNNEKNINGLKRELNLPINKKVILYAPTWRDDEFYERGKYKFTLQLKLDQLQDRLGDEYIILLRMHYFIASQLDISKYKGFAYDVSSYNDIAELYLISDILITDYSSVFFDYANLRRPILFYTYDLEKYRETLRGFYLDVENEVPGPLLKTTNDIIKSVINIDQVKKQYSEKYDEFYNRFCKWDDGRASEKTVQAVFNNDKT